MFSTKQSDIFYNDETKEMFVCTVSSISAERCEDNTIVYGALPLIYKINKADNYKKLVYPKNLDTFTTDPNSDIFNLTPTCEVAGTNFDSITKPLVNYNKTTSRYSVTFLGRYSSDTEGLGLNNYIFQDINSDFYLLDAKIYIPKDKNVTADGFTFDSGYLNSNLYVVGNTVRNDKPSWFNPAGEEVERSTDYQVAPMYVQSTGSLGFNLLLGNTDVTIDALSGNVAFPFMYSGGFITYNPKYVAYDPEYTIRVDFTARSFNVPAPTAYGSSQSVGQSATRWIQQWAPPGPGEGFCVSFFKNPPVSCYVIPNGIGSTLGYAKAGFSPNEVAGTAQPTDGLYIHNNWNPYTGSTGNVGDIKHHGPAESFLGIGFDIGGNFASTSEDKQGWTNGYSYTAAPCSVGIRASSYYDTQVLTSFAMNTVAASAVPMHTSAADAKFVDYRIDLSNKGTKVTLYNKLTSATDYNTIVEYRLNRGNCGRGVGVGTAMSYTYQPWYGMQSDQQIKDKELPPLNVGLSFTTSDNVSRFELHKFEVTGVKVSNPWLQKKQAGAGSTMKKIEYLQESSKNLRKKLLNVESDELVDIEMVIPAKNIIANTINEETNKPQITLCDGSNPDVVEEDVSIKIKEIDPNIIDKTIDTFVGGEIPKGVDYVSNTDVYGGPLAEDDTGQGEVFDPGAGLRDKFATQFEKFTHICETNHDSSIGPNGYPQYWLYKSDDIEYPGILLTGKKYNIYVRGAEVVPRGSLNTITILQDRNAYLEKKFLEEVRSQPDIRYWELKLFTDEAEVIGFPERYNDRYEDWFFQPLNPIDEEGNTINQEQLHNILKTTGGQKKYFFSLGVCKVRDGKQRTPYLDQTGDPYFASTTGEQSGAECIKITFTELQRYLDTVSTARGHDALITTVFQTIEWGEIEIPGFPGSKVVKLHHSGGGEPGLPGIEGTGKCYYITSGAANSKLNLEKIKDMKGHRS